MALKALDPVHPVKFNKADCAAAAVDVTYFSFSTTVISNPHAVPPTNWPTDRPTNRLSVCLGATALRCKEWNINMRRMFSRALDGGCWHRDGDGTYKQHRTDGECASVGVYTTPARSAAFSGSDMDWVALLSIRCNDVWLLVNVSCGFVSIQTLSGSVGPRTCQQAASGSALKISSS